jgi:hypothetical protein
MIADDAERVGKKLTFRKLNYEKRRKTAQFVGAFDRKYK